MMATRSFARNRCTRHTSTTGLVAMCAAALTGAAVVFSPAPPADALEVTQEVFTAGPLLGLLPALGVETLTIPLGALPVVGDTNLILNFNHISDAPADLYNTINALPFSQRSILSLIYDRVLGPPADPPTQFPMVLAVGIGSANLVAAYRAQISSVNGLTPPGYTPFEPGSLLNINQTNQVLGFLRNPLRPNGGLEARFAPILNVFGADTSVPAAGVNSATGIKLNTATLDVTWAYDPLSDFPVTVNPFSMLNSLMAALPTNLLGGVELRGVEDVTALGANVASVLGIFNRFTLGVAGVDDGQGWYGTLLPNDLPILEALRLPSRILSAIFGINLGSPIADALQPALTILVNTGYSDVVTPTDIAEHPDLYGAYQPYDRTFLTSGTPEPFLSVSPLTPAEWLAVPGDVFTALIEGFRDVFLPGAAPAPPASVKDPVVAPAATVEPEPLPPATVRRVTAGHSPPVEAAITGGDAAPAMSAVRATSARPARATAPLAPRAASRVTPPRDGVAAEDGRGATAAKRSVRSAIG